MQKLAALLAILALAANPADACTKITNDFGGIGVYSARDMGFCAVLGTQLAVYPRGLAGSGMVRDSNPMKWISAYGFVVTEETNLQNAAADGMNEKGFGAHLLYMDGTEMPPRNVTRPGVNAVLWVRYLLGNYATVSAALDGLANYQIVRYPFKIEGVDVYFPFHITMEDATGDAAVIEFIAGKLIVYHGRQYNVMTNEPPYNAQLENLAEVKQRDQSRMRL